MRILVATNHLHTLGGSETFTYSIIEELIRRRNFQVEYYTNIRGLVSEKIEKNLDVKFSTHDRYDLILANHTSIVEKFYGKGFLIQTCHGIFPELEQPHKRANAYVSISLEVHNYLRQKGITSKIILNGINLNRFKPNQKVSKKLETVLSMCQSEAANDLIKNSCDEMGLKFIAANKYQNPTWDMESLINTSDLVVGLGRSAYEGMACGRPVIIYDDRGYFDSCGDGYITDKVELSIKKNCSGRYFNKKFDKKVFTAELSKYCASDGDKLRKFAVNNLNIEDSVNSYLNYYRNKKWLYYMLKFFA
ncbi:glycosyltransferase family 4 protein [Antarcticibacterium flavum]|uniref:Glycosyltransferase family 4 protein n=1 Tax=Antarcticibacterium flavum TaxID=2058175 RepID=A0A5B7X5E1_9FLAO|nr:MULTISPECIES: glycosyltransferase family 4 protein [Antarcticibacterium]MCM4161407.1 UDP-glycosyltransferase [Antarcticibacterium sp. W02-3]QCY70569.1 glycosyltransferase family 4 protein [Antarcticibacterium flavum]